MARFAFVLLVALAAVSLRAQNQPATISARHAPAESLDGCPHVLARVARLGPPCTTRREPNFVNQAQGGPTFRTGTNYVRVDMYATLDGKSVDDLRVSDVELVEDGVAQTIESFEHVRVQPPGSQDSRVEPNTVAQSRDMVATTRGRVFVIFLDTYHTQIEGSANMRLPLIKFLDRVIGQDDMVAVMTPEMSAKEITFGRKTTVISNIMQNEWAWGRRGSIRQDQKEDLYDACYPQPSSNDPGPAPEMKARRREKLSLDALDDLVTHVGGLREERKGILTVTEGWVLYRTNQNLAANPKRPDPGFVDRILRRPTKPASNETGGPKEVNRVECDADRVALASLDHSLRLRTLTEEANRSNVTFYSIYPRGLAVFDAPVGPEKPPGRARDAGNLASRQDSLRYIAENTDGVSMVNTDNIEPLISRIIDDLSSYYLIGYSSSNTKLDGRFRSITVRVKREGVKIRARRGYRGHTADELVSSNAPVSGSADKPAASPSSAAAFNARAPFRIRTSTWLRDSTDDGRLGWFWVVGELDYQTRRQLAWTAGAQAEVVVLGADGTEVLSRTVDVKADEGPFSIQVPESGGIAAGEYALRVRIRSQADETTELTDTARVVLTRSSALGEAVMWRRGLSTGPRFLRTADPRFMRSDRLKLELATSSATPATARILDRYQKELSVPAQVSERPDPSGAFRWIVVDALLAPFAAGDYSLEVTQGREKRLTEFKIVP